MNFQLKRNEVFPFENGYAGYTDLIAADFHLTQIALNCFSSK